MLNLSSVLILQDNVRDMKKVRRLSKHVRAGKLLNADTCINGYNFNKPIIIARFKNEGHLVPSLQSENLYLLHDGHHRALAIYLGGREFFDESEFEFRDFQSFEDYNSVNFKAYWFTPMNIIQEIRHADIYPFKSCVAKITDEQEALKYIEEHRFAYCAARGGMYTIADLAQINRLSNMASEEGKIVIISGPSCAGKDTLIDKWMSVQPKAKKAITCTTRKPRDGEIDKVHYFFMSDEEFQQKVNEGNYFLEHMNVHGKWYGTPISEIQRLTENGGYVVVRVDVQGGMEIMPKFPDAITVFVNAESLAEIERRMRAVRKETEEEIQLRLANAVKEIDCAKYYQHCIINIDLEDAVRQLDEIVTQS